MAISEQSKQKVTIKIGTFVHCYAIQCVINALLGKLTVSNSWLTITIVTYITSFFFIALAQLFLFVC